MDFLNQILEVKKMEVKQLKNKYSLSSFTETEFFERKLFSFTDRVHATNSNSLSIIAELKKASPSKGIIKKDFNYLEIAGQYLKYGVNAISILTDKKFFQGDIQFLQDIAKIKTVPLLRKDFIIDEYQVFEAKAFGADLILLICEALSKNQITELTHTASEIGLEVLLELHSERQFEKINFKLNPIIGVNNRNLEDFSVNLETTVKLSKLIPDEVILVSESGIAKKEDIDYLKSAEIDAILIGEHLMKSSNIGKNIQKLKKWCLYEN